VAFSTRTTLFDFGRNSGIPSEAGLYEDALTAYRHLTEELGVAPSRIILSGRSLGSAVAIELATRVPSGGMLLLSAIDSVPARAARLYPWAPVTWLASLQFDSLAKAPRIRIPVLQVHAPEDWLVPLETARAVRAVPRTQGDAGAARRAQRRRLPRRVAESDVGAVLV
jgi:uncharacterized protein